MATYNPSNFAMIAGDEMSAQSNIPVAFGYYAETEVPQDIINGAGTGLPGGNFFGKRRSAAGIAVQGPLTPADKLLPSASLLLPRGTIILINGKNHVSPTPAVPKAYILYVIINSEAGFNTTYTSVYYWAQA